MAKITKMLIGESLVGDGNEVAHIDLINAFNGMFANSWLRFGVVRAGWVRGGQCG